ncbi:hypothetical protein KP509_03G046900 [Ceratopteris richardii]|uniref:Glycosyltransferase 2-like domain-containing protein n=1 Tax=Ceratopteris richardii TaxID=49495 RepID=A0A8T2VB81_CERRI|nr:hypothetical protein KP509_03G046900 [Ceratopteris richardii]KAH7441638.1 hypothetical protein KP509_03G046900 [Ceratopteris richardii]KAH7441639.1 hypothetical protein KP509_03G046900 [Ceratopteris richardii]
MAPRLDLGEWWRRETDNGGTPVVVKMEKPNHWSIPELGETDDTDFGLADKERGKNAKQLTWVMLLKAHQAVNGVTWLLQAGCALVSVIKKRLIFHEGVEDRPQRGRLFVIIKALLFFACIMLGFETIAYMRGWHFTASNIHIPRTEDVQGFFHAIYLAWIYVRANYIAPPLQSLSNVCVFLFLIQSLDRIIQCLGCAWIRLKGIKPIPKVESLDTGDLEHSFSSYPMVLIQIPMCNEREVYEQSIAAVAQIDWPRDRMLVQILDDSDDKDTQMLIRAEVQKWHQKGIRIMYRHRTLRTGYKAGNLKSAMTCDYVQDYEFVAIFDADFQPQPDFLKRTIIHFKDNEELGLVQARWSFVNQDENLLTRLQYINLSYHFEVEQQVNGAFLNFFGFNGTAGVWRIKALEGSGGWLERTTVEDMDIAVRAHLNGWKFIFLNDVKCQCEVPESYEAYRKQQHRWHSGPMQLFRLCFMDIVTSKISLWKKSNLIFLFFLLRKLILPFYSFTLFCIILPLTMFVPEAHLPSWVICYLPAIMSLMNIAPAPRSLPFIVPYLLFENTMSVTKFNAMVSGLFQLGNAYEWIVTKKVGRASETDLVGLSEKEALVEQSKLHRGSSEPSLNGLINIKDQTIMPRKRKLNQLYRKELALAFLLLIAAIRSLLSVQGVHFYFLLFQGISFLLVGLDLIGEQVS